MGRGDCLFGFDKPRAKEGARWHGMLEIANDRLWTSASWGNANVEMYYGDEQCVCNAQFMHRYSRRESGCQFRQHVVAT
jgi:hypothetical protein